MLYTLQPFLQRGPDVSGCLTYSLPPRTCLLSLVIDCLNQPREQRLAVHVLPSYLSESTPFSGFGPHFGIQFGSAGSSHATFSGFWECQLRISLQSDDTPRSPVFVFDLESSKPAACLPLAPPFLRLPCHILFRASSVGSLLKFLLAFILVLPFQHL
jgi:hypothetical protein